MPDDQNQTNPSGDGQADLPAPAPTSLPGSFDQPPDSSSVVIPPSEPVGPPPTNDNSAVSNNSSDDQSSGQNDDLLDIKQQALKQLNPMLKHLDQTPEEKFRTTMMMIQANDDRSLIKDAYEAAQQIVDEKEKAQALLDVVNEINYFTNSQED